MKLNGIIASNPCEDARLENASGSTRAETKKHMPFTVKELNKIFNAPIYTTGVWSNEHWFREGKYQIRDSRYWAPLIGLFTGARLAEIGQLLIADIVDFNGMKHFRVTDSIDEKEMTELGITEKDLENRTIKTFAGNRHAPVHPTLIKIGFLDFVEEQKARTGEAHRLFEKCWKLSKNDMTYSANFSKKFGRFLGKIGVKEKWNSFHSFRHTFKDAMRSAEIPEEIQNRFMGHSDGKVQSIYGTGDLLPVQSKRINDIQFDGLEPDHLG